MSFCLLGSSTSPVCSWKRSPSMQVQFPLADYSIKSPFCWEGNVFAARFMMFEIDFFDRLYFARVLVFCFHRTSLPSLDRAQSCKSLWNRFFLVLFSGLLNLVFRVFFRKTGGVILSWGLLCAAHFLMSLSRILGVGSRLMKQFDEIIYLFIPVFISYFLSKNFFC